MLKNKLYAIGLVALGAASMLLTYDATFLVFTLLFGVPMFFSKEEWIS